MKKLLCIFLSVIMLVSFCSAGFASAETYSVEGPATVYTLGSGNYQKVCYKLKDDSGYLIEDAEFSLSSEISGLYMSPNGELRITGSIADGVQVMVKANYNGSIYQKQITFKPAVNKNMDAWNQTNTLFWGTLAANEWLDKGNGDKYISPSSNKSLKTDANTVFGLFRVGNQTSYTFQFDTYVTDAAISKGALFVLSGINSNAGGWWERPEYYNKNTTNGTVDIKSYNGTNLGTFDIGSWITIRIVVDTNAGYYDIYMNNNSPVRITNTSTPGINSAVIYVPFDNIKMYTGDVVSENAFSVEIKNSPVITRPLSDGTADVTLTAQVRENGTVVQGHPVQWSLVSDYQGVSILDNILTVSSDADNEIEVKATVAGTSKSVTKKFFVLNPGEENLLVIDGDADFTVPLTGTVTSIYTAKDVFDTSLNPTWSVSPENQGVSIDNSGLLTITNSAVAGTYTISAVSGDKSGSFDITTTLTTLSIKGDTEIMLPGEDVYAKFSYTLEDNSGNTYPATFSLSPETRGCYVSNDGILRLMGADLSPTSTLSIIADYGSAHVELPLTFVRGYSEDFTSNYWGSSSNVATDADGNKYHSPDGSRADSPTIMAEPGFKNLTLEFDYKPANTAQSVNLSGAREPGSDNYAMWWMEFKAAKSDNTATVNLSSGSSKIAQNYIHTMNGDWIGVKITISAVTGDVSLYLDGNHVADGLLSAAHIDFYVKSIISYADIDNVKIYGGESGKASDFTVDILNDTSVPEPSQTQAAVINLSAKVKENGTELPGHPVDWSLGQNTDKAIISGNKLTIYYGAPARVELVATVPCVNATDSVNLELSNPDVYIEKTSSGVKFTGTPSDTVDVTLYKPLDSSNTVKAFLASGDNGVALSQSENLSFTLGADGTYDFNMSSYAPGVYKIYATSGNVENYLEIVHRFEAVLGGTDAVTNMDYEADFKNLLSLYTNMTGAEINDAYSAYKTLTHKQSVADIAKAEINDFGLAVSVIEFAENAKATESYPKQNATELSNALKAAGYSDIAYTLLGKNTDYVSVLNSMDTADFTGMTEYLEELKNNSIIYGIRVIYHVDNAKVFLKELGNSKYNSATYTQQTYICSNVGNKIYTSVSDINLAINSLQLPQENQGSSGSSAGSRPTGSGSIPVAGGSTPVTPPAEVNPQQSIFSDITKEHWGYEAVSALSKAEIINGSDGKFRPEDNITRAEFVKILSVAFNLPAEVENAFTDVNSTDWFAPYVNAGYKTGLVLGSEGKFNPYANITRQDAALLVYRFATYYGKVFDSSAFAFVDEDNISDYAKDAVSIMAANGIINGIGDGTFAPLSNMTRVQAAKLLHNLIGGDLK